MKKLYNQYRRDQWTESSYSMPVIARFGTGGGNMPIVLESSQNHATAKDTEVCPSLPASMGLGGGYVPMIVDTLVFDESQITSRQNRSRPTWGGAATHCTATPTERS